MHLSIVPRHSIVLHRTAKKTQIFFDTHEHRVWASHEELTAKDFAWAVRKLVGCYTNVATYESR
jgi:hypothetical protein